MYYVLKVSGFAAPPSDKHLDREALVSVVAYYPVLEIVDGVAVEDGGELTRLVSQALSLVDDARGIEVLRGPELAPASLERTAVVEAYKVKGRERTSYRVVPSRGGVMTGFVSLIKAAVNAVVVNEDAGRALAARRDMFEKGEEHGDEG